MLFAWGANSHGQLGIGFSSEQENLATLVDTDGNIFKKITGGGAHTLAISSGQENQLYGCGNNDRGQLGLSHSNPVNKFSLVGETGVSDIAGGWDFSLVLLQDGSVKGAGSNKYCQLGQQKETHDQRSFSSIPGLQNILQISAGLRHAAAVDNHGDVYTWGSGSKGQLGRKWKDLSDSSPTSINFLSQFGPAESVHCGQYFTVVKLRNGDLVGFGENKFKQLDNSEEKALHSPTLLSLRNVQKVCTGWTHCVAMSSSLKVMTWGRNSYGQCCTGQFTKFVHIDDTSHYHRIQAIADNCVNVLSGSEHCLLLRANGSVYTWGWNEHGSLGTGDADNSTQPTLVKLPDGKKAREIFVGSAHCFALVA